MFSCTVSRQEDSAGWRSTRESGGGAVFEMASHAIDLVNFVIGKPDKVTGSSLNRIYSKNVEDAVSSTFFYNNGVTGTIYVNWSDPSYRKPTNKLEIFGDEGRIQADQHSIKIFLKNPNQKYNLREGWNTLYITDVFKQVPFYVRGNEFTNQLYHFIGCIKGEIDKNQCTFADGICTLEVIESIFKDFEQNGRI
jgi:predicted dehydrogenase